MAGQRTWHRVETPGTFRGHAMEANIGGSQWRGWENPDGTWSLSVDGGEPVVKRDWTDVRTSAERSQNPMNPMLAGAAATGMAIAMRDHLINNPGAPPESSIYSSGYGKHRAVMDALGRVPVVKGPRADRFGNMWIMVGRGYGRVARRAVRRARFRFPVQVMEAA